MNCFFGNNGMGKTNLLDAIYYLSFCKSHLHTSDTQIIHNGQEMCLIQGTYAGGERTEEIFCTLQRKHRKQFKRNRKEYDKLSEHIGLLPLVMVSPADAVLIQGGSDERRRFLDLVIAQHDKRYLNTLIHYNSALLRRNVLLRNQSTDNTLYEVLEMQMDSYARQLFDSRRQWVEEFIPVFDGYYRTICRSTEQVGLSYLSQLTSGEALSTTLLANRDRDRLLGYTTSGTHKDELEMTLDGDLIRRTGSQGQNKTYLIALKLAQLAFLANKGAMPILLLDDIFDKLDAARVEQIIHLVSGNGFGQIFITDTNRKYLDEILTSTHRAYTLFEVENGTIHPKDAFGGC